MQSNIVLLTGIPRSGTTLCCKLLNNRGDVVALHEPINPGQLPKELSVSKSVEIIQNHITQLRHAIVNGLPFNHGDKGGLEIDNPVGLDEIEGVRQVIAQRGLVQLAPRDASSFTLVVKQNALFTALLQQLKVKFPIYCVVRNPVDVLLSWMTVDLPVNRGRIPAGERFSRDLRSRLEGKSIIERQITIYQWFIEQFKLSQLPIMRYEDVISTNAAALDNILGLSKIPRKDLHKKPRKFNSNIGKALKSAHLEIQNIDCGGLYTPSEINTAFESIQLESDN